MLLTEYIYNYAFYKFTLIFNKMMKCITHKPAQYVCINKKCKQQNAYLCADPHDTCKSYHQCCSLVSWTFLVKKVKNPENKISKSQYLKPIYQTLMEAAKQIELQISEETHTHEMKEIIGQQYLTANQKEKISNFLNDNLLHISQTNNDRIFMLFNNVKKSIAEYQTAMKQFKRTQMLNLRQKQDEIQKISKSKVGMKQSQSKISQNNESPSRVKLGVMASKIPTPVKSGLKEPSEKKGSNIKLTSTIDGHVPKPPLFSKITNQIETIYTFFYNKFVKASLLYRASQHDYSVLKFHQRCDGHSNTLTIVLTQQQHILGGYTPIPWNSGGGDYCQDPQKKSFLFNLSKQEKYPLQIKQKAIWCGKKFGPSFGHPDLEISDKAFQNSNSCANFPTCYNNGNYVYNEGSTQSFCGSNTGHFRVKQWEVYELQFPEQ